MRRVFIYMALLFLIGGCGVDPITTNNVGNLQMRTGSVDSALRTYQAAQVIAPDGDVPYLNAGIVFLEQGEYLRAEAALKQALVTVDDDRVAASANFALGEAHFNQGEYIDAARAYQQVLLREPDDEDARYNFELSLRLIPSPTSPPQPTPTDPNMEAPQQTTETATPSPTAENSPEEEETTPTPTPETNSEDEPPTQTPPNPPPDDEEGEDGVPSPMPQSEAEQILNDNQRQQNILIPQEETAVPAGAPPERDW